VRRLELLKASDETKPLATRTRPLAIALTGHSASAAATAWSMRLVLRVSAREQGHPMTLFDQLLCEQRLLLLPVQAATGTDSQ
jgi:hypothetical protein